MLKKLFFIIVAGNLLSLPLLAETTNVHYKTYIDCYYQLTTNIKNTGIIAFTNEEIKSKLKAPDQIYDLYIFSPDGFYGLTSMNKPCGCESIENFSCSYDFQIQPDSKVTYNLCYLKTWAGTNKGCTETVVEDTCDNNKINIAHRLLKNINPTIYKSPTQLVQLSKKYYETILYPKLQAMFTETGAGYVWGANPIANICGDGTTVVMDDGSKGQKQLQQRVDEFNNFSARKDCFTSCKLIDSDTKDSKIVKTLPREVTASKKEVSNKRRRSL